MKGLSLLSIFCVFYSISTFARTSVLAECKISFSSGEVVDEKTFQVLRDGDRLYSRFRNSKVEDYVESDDVTRILFEGQRLDDFFDNESNSELIQAFESNRSKIKKIFFYGIEQKNRPEEPELEGKYLFEIWFGQTEFSNTRTVLIKDNLKKCRFNAWYWPFGVI